MKKSAEKNRYTHSIDLVPLKIRNQARDDFRRALEAIEYRGYVVERLNDGRKIVITKPGGKSKYGLAKREDFLVWIFNRKDNTLWLISQKKIYLDLEEKGKEDSKETIKIIEALEKVCNGAEPDDVLAGLHNPCGEPLDLLFKAYKWIWGQEDCNYPTRQGRMKSMKRILKLRDQLRS